MTEQTYDQPPPPPPPPVPPAPNDDSEWLDSKVVIAVLIGLVSVTGAVLTWRSALLGSAATDSDRQAIVETVAQQQNQAAAETTLRSEQEAFASYRANLDAAAKLRAEARELRDQDLEAEAEAALAEARALRAEADELVALIVPLQYVTTDDEGVLQFDEALRRDDLRRQDVAATNVDPLRTAANGDALRYRSQRLVGFIVILAAAVVVLTLAELTRRYKLRFTLAGVAMAVYVVATIVAFAGDHA